MVWETTSVNRRAGKIDKAVEKTELKSAAAYRLLKRAIITHELAPSQKVSENLIVDQFALTKSAARAAVASLVFEGLIVARSPKLQVIAPLTMADIRETFRLRNLLEPEAARLAAGKADITHLRALNAQCQQPYRIGDRDEEFGFLMANAGFHIAIAQSAGLPRLARWIEELHDQTMRCLWISLQAEGRAGAWAHGHDEILEALEAGDSEAAAAIALAHLHAGQRLIFDILSSMTPLGAMDVLTPEPRRA